MTFRSWVLLQLDLVLQSRLRPKTLKDYEKKAKVLVVALYKKSKARLQKPFSLYRFQRGKKDKVMFFASTILCVKIP